jgi:hypothetical protein
MRRLPLALRQRQVVSACVLCVLDHLRVGRDHVGRQDRQHGNFGADALGQGDAVVDSFPGKFRPVCGYQDMGIHRLSLIYRSVLGRISQKQKCLPVVSRTTKHASNSPIEIWHVSKAYMPDLYAFYCERCQHAETVKKEPSAA